MSRRLDFLLPSWLEDVDAFGQYTNENMITVMYTVVVNMCIMIICVLFFSIYRMYDDKLYAPKSDMFPERTPPKISNSSPFGWTVELFAMDDQLIIDKGGYDALFLIRFYRLGFKILLWSSVYCLAVLVPINGTANSRTDLSSFGRWSMTNIDQGSAKCWFHLIGVFIFTSITIYFLEREYVIYAKYRHIFLRQTHAHLRTVLVEGIPTKFRSPATLGAYFEVLYPGAIKNIKLAQNIRYLESLVLQRENAVAELERHLYRNHNSHTRPTINVGHNMMTPVDTIEHYTKELRDLNRLIAREQRDARRLGEYDNTKKTRDPTDALSPDHQDTLDEFLKVTEIKNTNKTFKDSKTVAVDAVSRSRRTTRAGEDDSQSVYSQSSYQQSNVVSFSTDLGGSDDSREERDPAEWKKKLELSMSRDVFDMLNSDAEDEVDEDGFNNDEPEAVSPGFLRSSKLTFSEWFCEVWNAPSCLSGWQKVKRGRKIRDSQDDETSTLLTPSVDKGLFLSKGFVTFKTFASATTARQVVHMQLADRMSITEAPEPTDVTWDNLYTTRKGMIWRRIVVEFAVLMLIVVWIAPVTLLSYIFSQDALTGFFPWIGVWCDESDFFTSMIDLLQPLVLVAIMNLLPPILNFLAEIEGCTSWSKNHMRSYNRYFLFQIINVFLVTTIAGSVVTVLEDIVSDPTSTFELLGDSLPAMGGFFMNYILVKALTGLGMEIMRFPALFSAMFKQLFSSNITPRDRSAFTLFGAVRNPSNPGWFPFAKIYAQDMLLFVVSATYACVAPLVIVAGMMYFAGAAYIYKHQMLYVYEPIYETGGKWWPKMAGSIVIALLFAQATMVGMFILKETYVEIYFMALLFAFTTGYYWYVASVYEPLANQLPLDMAMAMDRQLAALGNDDQMGIDGEDDYLQPAIRAKAVQPNVEFDLKEMTILTDV